MEEGDVMYYMEYKEIGRRIAERRKKLRMTQAEVEDRANLSRKYLSNIEHGRSVPSIDVLMQIADVLHSTPNEFLLGADLTGRSELAAALTSDIQRLPEDKQAIAKSFIGWLEEQQP